jgi:hypothetical protein
MSVMRESVAWRDNDLAAGQSARGIGMQGRRLSRVHRGRLIVNG